MSIHDSALADAELAIAIEGVICNVCARAPTYAADLVQQAGELPSSSQVQISVTQPWHCKGTCCRIRLVKTGNRDNSGLVFHRSCELAEWHDCVQAEAAPEASCPQGCRP